MSGHLFLATQAILQPVLSGVALGLWVCGAVLRTHRHHCHLKTGTVQCTQEVSGDIEIWPHPSLGLGRINIKPEFWGTTQQTFAFESGWVDLKSLISPTNRKKQWTTDGTHNWMHELVRSQCRNMMQWRKKPRTWSSQVLGPFLPCLIDEFWVDTLEVQRSWAVFAHICGLEGKQVEGTAVG